MPLTLASLQRTGEKRTTAADAAVLEADRLAAEARAEAERVRRAASAELRQAEEDLKAAERRHQGAVKALAMAVADSRARADLEAAGAPLALRWLRDAARSYLRGTLPSPGELMGPEVVIVNADPVAARLLGTAREAGQVVVRAADDLG